MEPKKQSMSKSSLSQESRHAKIKADTNCKKCTPSSEEVAAPCGAAQRIPVTLPAAGVVNLEIPLARPERVCVHSVVTHIGANPLIIAMISSFLEDTTRPATSSSACFMNKSIAR